MASDMSYEELEEYFKNRYKKKPVEMNNGETYNYYYLDAGEAAIILTRFENGDYVMVKQTRPAIEAIAISFPGGMVDPGEDPLEAAKREAREETGYEVTDIQFLCKGYPSAGNSNAVFHLYIATLGEYVGQELDATESVEVRIVKKEKFEEMFEEGKIEGLPSVTAYLMAKHKGLL
jgi:8-oxo-dGTP pyrophosphatase MutT (NUDIX family)